MIIDVTLAQAKELGAQFQNKQGNQIGMGLNSIELTNLSSGADLTRNQLPAGSEEVGMKNLAIENEFGSEDGLALIPYIRESRRLKGDLILNLNDQVPFRWIEFHLLRIL